MATAPDITEVERSEEMDPLMRKQFIEAEIAKLGNLNFTELRERVVPEDKKVAGAVAGGGMTLSASMGGKPVPREKVTIYKTETGEPCEVLIYNLAKYMTRVHPGTQTPVFSWSPRVPYHFGETLCWFHPNNPKRAYYDSIGLRGKVCQSAHLASPYEARLHAQSRHKKWYETVLDNEKEEQKGLETTRWEALFAMAGHAGKQPTLVTEPEPYVRHPLVQEVLDEARMSGLAPRPVNYARQVTCEVCGKVLAHAGALQGHKRTHEKEAS